MRNTSSRASVGPYAQLASRSEARSRGYCWFRDRDGKRRNRVFPGPYDSDESRNAYAAFLRSRLDERDGPTAKPGTRCPSVTVELLCERFLAHAAVHYRLPDGTPTHEIQNVAIAMRELLDVARDLPASAITPRILKRVRALMVETGRLSRQVINKRVEVIRRVFRWGAEEELVSGSVWRDLSAVRPLQAGRTTAREAVAPEPAPDADVERTLPHLPPSIAAMVQVMRLTGARPSEIFRLTPAMVDRRVDPWRAELRIHKTAWRGKTRTLIIGPRAQEILRPYLDRIPQRAEEPVFSPRMAELERAHAARENAAAPRTTPLRGRAVVGDRWDAHAFRRAIVRACDAARVPQWTPYGLRRGCADQLERELGLEAAGAALGHSKMTIAARYATLELERRAVAAMNRFG